jgi:hypothetical protein
MEKLRSSRRVKPPKSLWRNPRLILADAVVALLIAICVGLVLGSLTAAGIISVGLAYFLLVLTWLLAMWGTFVTAAASRITQKHRIVFGVILAILLGGIGLFEHSYGQSTIDTAKEAPKSNVTKPETQTLSSQQKPQPESTKSEHQGNERVITNATPEDIIGLFKNRTSIQAKPLVQSYIGKWMKVSGKVGNVTGEKTSGKQWAAIVFSDRGSFTKLVEVTPFFEEPWIDRVAALAAGDMVTVLGRITTIKYNRIDLFDCELLEVRVPKSQGR